MDDDAGALSVPGLKHTVFSSLVVKLVGRLSWLFAGHTSRDPDCPLFFPLQDKLTTVVPTD